MVVRHDEILAVLDDHHVVLPLKPVDLINGYSIGVLDPLVELLAVLLDVDRLRAATVPLSNLDTRVTGENLDVDLLIPPRETVVSGIVIPFQIPVKLAPMQFAAILSIQISRLL